MRAVLAGVAALALGASAQAAIQVSWEGPPNSEGAQYDGAAGGYVGDTNVSTFTTTGASHGTYAIQVVNDQLVGWRNMMKIYTGGINTELSNGPKKISIDATFVQTNPGDIWWNQLVVCANGQTTPWTQLAAVSFARDGLPHTVSWELPDQPDGQGWLGLHFIWNSGGPGGTTARGNVYLDNLRIEAVPEPTILAGVAISSLGLMIRRRQK